MQEHPDLFVTAPAAHKQNGLPADVLTAIRQALSEELRAGRSVRLKDLGTWTPYINTEGKRSFVFHPERAIVQQMVAPAAKIIATEKTNGTAQPTAQQKVPAAPASAVADDKPIGTFDLHSRVPGELSGSVAPIDICTLFREVQQEKSLYHGMPAGLRILGSNGSTPSSAAGNGKAAAPSRLNGNGSTANAILSKPESAQKSGSQTSALLKQAAIRQTVIPTTAVATAAVYVSTVAVFEPEVADIHPAHESRRRIPATDASSPQPVAHSGVVEETEHEVVFRQNRERLFHPPVMKRASPLNRLALALTMIIAFIVVYMLYVGGSLNSILPADMRYRQSIIHKHSTRASNPAPAETMSGITA